MEDEDLTVWKYLRDNWLQMLITITIVAFVIKYGILGYEKDVVEIVGAGIGTMSAILIHFLYQSFNLRKESRDVHREKVVNNLNITICVLVLAQLGAFLIYPVHHHFQALGVMLTPFLIYISASIYFRVTKGEPYVLP